jgi:multidrug efflux pump subunit AcrB
MIGIVRVALSRPLTFIVMAILIALIGVISAITTPVDIFPNIRVPVIATAWQYSGLSPDQMSGRIITPFERVLTTTVNDIDHIESQSMQGIGVVKIYFQPGADIRTATAQVTSVSQTVLKQLPPGITPPLILNYNASTVPKVPRHSRSPSPRRSSRLRRFPRRCLPRCSSAGPTSPPRNAASPPPMPRSAWPGPHCSPASRSARRAASRRRAATC